MTTELIITHNLVDFRVRGCCIPADPDCGLGDDFEWESCEPLVADPDEPVDCPDSDTITRLALQALEREWSEARAEITAARAEDRYYEDM